MPRWINFTLLIFLLMVICSIPLAQQLETGSMEGTITDDFGPVANAPIQAMNVMTGTASQAQSDASGNYKFESLRAGRYSLWVQAIRHDSLWIREVIVKRGESTRQDIHLNKAWAIPTGR